MAKDVVPNLANPPRPVQPVQPQAGLKEIPVELKALADKALKPETRPAVGSLEPGALPDPEADRLRRELVAKEQELDNLRAEIARRDAADQPLPDSGPGEYQIVLRHAPTRLKKLKVQAGNEREAWDLFCREALKREYNPKDPLLRAVKRFERFLSDGRVNGFDRSVMKVA